MKSSGPCHRKHSKTLRLDRADLEFRADRGGVLFLNSTVMYCFSFGSISSAGAKKTAQCGQLIFSFLLMSAISDLSCTKETTSKRGTRRV